MKCNKIKKLTTDPEDVVKALNKSTVLELNEANDAVKRRIPFVKSSENADSRTLYVESLPTFANHDWITVVFQRFGKVNYVEMPYYRMSRQNKGFAFIEFENETSVTKALEAFSKFNGVLLETDVELASGKRQAVDTVKHNGGKTKERKIKNSEKDADGEENFPKLPRIESSSLAEKENKIEEIIESAPISDEKGNVEVSDASMEKEDTAEETEKEDEETVKAMMENAVGGQGNVVKKKSRKKKRIPIKALLEKSELQLAIDAIYYEMKILPKESWKRLQKIYKNLQKQNISKLKKELKQKLDNNKLMEGIKEQQQSQSESQPDVSELTNDSIDTITAKNSTSKLQEPMNMNFYGAAQEGATTTDGSGAGVSQPATGQNGDNHQLKHGLIVQIMFLEPCLDPRDFRNEMRQNASVKYVDVKEGKMKAYIRLESAEAAQEFIKKTHCAEYQCTLLSGDNELQYWHKIENDRIAKRNKSVKINLRRRGREKIKKLLGNHKYFNEDDDEDIGDGGRAPPANEMKCD